MARAILVLQPIYAIIGVVGILGNALVLYVLVKVNFLKTTTNVFILNQSIIDLCTCIVFLIYYMTSPIIFDEPSTGAAIFCYLWESGYVYWALAFSSTANLICLTLERYFAILHPIKFKNYFDLRRAYVFLVVPWVFGFCSLLYFGLTNQINEDNVCTSFRTALAGRIWGIIVFCIQCAIPLVCMAIVYTKIALYLRSHRVVSQSSAVTVSNPATRATTKKSRNVLKTLFLVCGSYFICWTPNQVFYLYVNLAGITDFKGAFFYVTVVLVNCNPCVNPIIYTWKYNQFKRGLAKVFPAMCSRNSKCTDGSASPTSHPNPLPEDTLDSTVPVSRPVPGCSSEISTICAGT